MKLFLMLFMVLASFGYADVTPTAGAFFEPTQEDWNTASRAIVAQQAEYTKARDEGDLELAVSKSLWHFQVMWLYFNEGIDSFKNAKGDMNELHSARKFLALARVSAEKAKEAGHHKKEWTACLNLLQVNEVSLDKEIANQSGK